MTLRESLVVGDVVKLGFRVPQPYPIVSEWMFVKVTKVENGRYTGVQESKPAHVPNLIRGRILEFGPEHVEDVVHHDGSTAIGREFKKRGWL